VDEVKKEVVLHHHEVYAPGFDPYSLASASLVLITQKKILLKELNPANLVPCTLARCHAKKIIL